jgi:hypothetical protein
MTQDFLDSLKQRIASERTLKESSLNAYVFNLDKLYRVMGRSGDMASLDFLEDTDAVHKALEDKKDSTKKNFYSSAVVGLMAMAKDRGVLAQHYRYKMDELQNAYLQNQRGQKKSEKQTKNWATLAELRKILRNLLKRIKQRGLQWLRPKTCMLKCFPGSFHQKCIKCFSFRFQRNLSTT